jgi:hypothetical protein
VLFGVLEGKSMNISPSKCPACTEWKSLYRAAIFETDRNAIREVVSRAEQAMVARRKEVFREPRTLEEEEALEDALYALRAFKSAESHLESA